MILKMKVVKNIIVIIVVFSLVGCQPSSSLDDVIYTTIEKANNTEVSTTTNLQKDFYSLYYGREIGKVDSDLISNIFSYNDVKYILVVNVNNIIKDRYYHEASTVNITSTVNEYENVHVFNGQFVDYGNEITDYIIELAELENDTVYLKFSTRYLSLASIIEKNMISSVLEKMFVMAKTTRIHYDKIIEYFANVETLQEQYAYTESIFEKNFPEEGYLGDLIKKDDEDYIFGNAETGSEGEIIESE